MAIVYVAVFVLVCLACWALRRRRRAARVTFGLALVLAALPYLLLVEHLWRSISGFGPPAAPPNGIYPGLLAFAVMGVLLTLGLLGLSLRLAAAHPVLAGLLPLLLGGLFWYGLRSLLVWRIPGTLYWDNMPLIWVAGFSALAALLLVTTGAGALGRHDDNRSRPGAPRPDA